MLIYIAGPYRAKYGRSVAENIAAAKTVAIECWQHGHYAVTPHLNTAHFEDVAPEIPDEVWLAGTMAMQARCDAILMLDTWQSSEGAIAEHDYAQQVGQPIYYYPDIPSERLAERRFIMDEQSAYILAQLEQPVPIPSGDISCHDLAISWVKNPILKKLIEGRKAIGLARYGAILTPHNGRAALFDMIQELVDAIVYGFQLRENTGRNLFRFLSSLEAVTVEAIEMEPETASEILGDS
jgi:hypothetical protein